LSAGINRLTSLAQQAIKIFFQEALKIPTAGIPVSYAQTGLKLPSRRKKINLDNKIYFGYLDEYCLHQWGFQYVVLQHKLIHNPPSSIYPV